MENTPESRGISSKFTEISAKSSGFPGAKRVVPGIQSKRCQNRQNRLKRGNGSFDRGFFWRFNVGKVVIFGYFRPVRDPKGGPYLPQLLNVAPGTVLPRGPDAVPDTC